MRSSKQKNASTAPATTKPSRGRFKVEGDKLYITSTIDESGTKDVQGLHFYSSTKAHTVMILQKQ